VNIIIVGGGVVGTALAQQLEKKHLNHKITIIENDFERGQKLSNKLDILTIHGSGLDPEVLLQAGIDSADIIIAVTSSDETNVLCCYLASRFDVATRAARLRTSVFSNEMFGLRELGVTDIIEPETESINEILEYLHVPALTEIVNFKQATIAVRGFKVSQRNALVNRKASEIHKITGSDNILLLVILRNGVTIVPNGDTEIEAGDELLTLMPIDALNEFRSIFRENGVKIPKVVISGDSQMAVSLARQVEKISKRTILITEDETFSRHCSEILHNTDIFLGDPSSEETLADAGVHTCSYFISVDEDGEENIMSSLLAKAEGAEQVIAVTNNEKHSQLFRTLGIDHLIQPKKVTTQRIFTDVLGLSKGALFSHSKMNMDIGHFMITPATNLEGVSIIEIRQKAKREFIIGCIIREEQVIMVTGITRFREGDEVIVFYNSNDTKQIAKLFKA